MLDDAFGCRYQLHSRLSPVEAWLPACLQCRACLLSHSAQGVSHLNLNLAQRDARGSMMRDT